MLENAEQKFFITTNGTNGNALIAGTVSYTLSDNTTDKISKTTERLKKAN